VELVDNKKPFPEKMETDRLISFEMIIFDQQAVNLLTESVI